MMLEPALPCSLGRARVVSIPVSVRCARDNRSCGHPFRHSPRTNRLLGIFPPAPRPVTDPASVSESDSAIFIQCHLPVTVTTGLLSPLCPFPQLCQPGPARCYRISTQTGAIISCLNPGLLHRLVRSQVLQLQSLLSLCWNDL